MFVYMLIYVNTVYVLNLTRWLWKQTEARQKSCSLVPGSEEREK